MCSSDLAKVDFWATMATPEAAKLPPQPPDVEGGHLADGGHHTDGGHLGAHSDAGEGSGDGQEGGQQGWQKANKKKNRGQAKTKAKAKVPRTEDTFTEVTSNKVHQRPQGQGKKSAGAPPFKGVLGKGLNKGQGQPPPASAGAQIGRAHV